MKNIVLLLAMLCSVELHAQLFKNVGHFISMEDDWLVGASFGIDGPMYNGRNAYTSLLTTYMKLSAAKYYTAERGFRVEVAYQWQDAVSYNKNGMVHNTNNVSLMGDEMWCLSKIFFDKRADSDYSWDMYYGLGFNLVNTHDLVTTNGKASTTQNQYLYPKVHLGTVFRYAITKRAEAFADLSCNFTASNMGHLHHGSLVYGELGLGIIWRIPTMSMKRYKIER